MDKLSLLLCTRKRPEKLQLCLKSIRETVNNFSNIEIIFGSEVGDIPQQNIINEFMELNKDIKCQHWQFEPETFLNDKYNCIASKANNNLIMALADDLVFKTMAWDKIIIDEFDKVPNDKIFIMWINDGTGCEKLPRHYIIHKNYMSVTGGYNQGVLIHFCSDNWIYEVASKINRYKFLENVVVSHSSPYITQNQNDRDEVINHDEQLFGMFDRHTYMMTQKYRDYEVRLLNEYIDSRK